MTRGERRDLGRPRDPVCAEVAERHDVLLQRRFAAERHLCDPHCAQKERNWTARKAPTGKQLI